MPAEEQVHVLMVSLALQGHMNPMLKFGKHLTSKGVHVTLATLEEAKHRMLKNKASGNLENSSDQEIQLQFFSDGLSLGFDREKDIDTWQNSVLTTGSKNFSNLVSNLSKTQRYSCMIINPFVPWAVDVADEHGIPCALLWIQSCALYSIYYRYFKNINSFPNLEDPNESVQLPGMPLLEVRDLPSFLLPSSPPIFAKLLLKLFRDLDKKVKWVLGSSFYEIEEDIVKSMTSLTPIYPIGPIVSPFLLGEKENNSFNVDMWNAEDSCMEWLDSKPASSVIYISFGSIILLSQKQIDNIAMALKNSNKAFLWVMKAPEKGSEGNGGVLPPEFLEESKGNGLVVKWCPQERVLMHPAIACFMTHCGWNSTLETLVTGVPVIAHPKWTDQPANAKLLANAFNVGVKINYEEDGVASAEEVERCIREITDGPRTAEIKKRATELKEAAKKALEDGGSSDRNINQFISEIAGKHQLWLWA